MRDLHHYSCAGAGLRIGAFSTTVHHMLQYLESFFNKLMGFYAFDVDEQTDTAGIVLIAAVV